MSSSLCGNGQKGKLFGASRTVVPGTCLSTQDNGEAALKHGSSAHWQIGTGRQEGRSPHFPGQIFQTFHFTVWKSPLRPHPLPTRESSHQCQNSPEPAQPTGTFHTAGTRSTRGGAVASAEIPSPFPGEAAANHVGLPGSADAVAGSRVQAGTPH